MQNQELCQETHFPDGYSYMQFTDRETEPLKAKSSTLRGFASKFVLDIQLSNLTTASNADHCSASTFYSPSAFLVFIELHTLWTVHTWFETRRQCLTKYSQGL